MDEEMDIQLEGKSVPKSVLDEKLKFLKELKVHITTSGNEKGLIVKFDGPNVVNIHAKEGKLKHVMLYNPDALPKNSIMYSDEKSFAILVDWKTRMPDSYYFFYKEQQ